MEERLKIFLNSKAYYRATFVLAILVVLSLTFLAGVQVGIHKARYSFEWGENYEKNFIGPRKGMMGLGGLNGPHGFFPSGPREMRNAHGLGGEVISISDNVLVIKDRDNKENTITINSKTLIKSGRDDIELNDIKSGDNLVILGKPGENGTVAADLIRIFDKQ
ncbi:MAG: hypothetical protein ACD_5C00253G0008 [uncultured bacterium]|nr:MAG: hypothetical protein ACD_5C00253G0008 [uncultured bacterium]